ncbi:MAG TPA: hypothetical protein VE133_03495, partial [Candidatus Sulfotelmatobacter sp.]|nr:hypothetical protein [Candidatus Sulfotelmatobacter sp.]
MRRRLELILFPRVAAVVDWCPASRTVARLGSSLFLVTTLACASGEADPARPDRRVAQLSHAQWN